MRAFMLAVGYTLLVAACLLVAVRLAAGATVLILRAAGRWRCPFCPERFTTPDRLARHIECHEPYDQWPACPHCHVRFPAGPAALAEHQHTEHPDTPHDLDTITALRHAENEMVIGWKVVCTCGQEFVDLMREDAVTAQLHHRDVERLATGGEP